MGKLLFEKDQYMKASTFFSTLGKTPEEATRILNGCPMTWVKHEDSFYNIKITKDALNLNTYYISIIDTMVVDNSVKEILYTLKELVDEIQPILKEQVLVLQITKVGRRYKVYTLEHEEVENLDRMYVNDINVIYIDGYNDCGSFTKQAIKNTIKLMFEARKTYKEEQELEVHQEVIENIDNETFVTDNGTKVEVTILDNDTIRKEYYFDYDNYRYTMSMHKRGNFLKCYIGYPPFTEIFYIIDPNNIDIEEFKIKLKDAIKVLRWKIDIIKTNIFYR